MKWLKKLFKRESVKYHYWIVKKLFIGYQIICDPDYPINSYSSDQLYSGPYDSLEEAEKVYEKYQLYGI